MSVIYRFDIGTMSGYVCGSYTLEQALTWAIEDARGAERQPYEIVADGEVKYTAEDIWRLSNAPTCSNDA